MSCSIWSVRRDLRLYDNQALAEARANSDTVIPVFVLDPTLLASPDLCPDRLAFLLLGFRELDNELRRLGSRLIVRQGEPVAELTALLAETGASSIHAEADPWPYGRAHDRRVEASLTLRLAGGLTIRKPEEIRKADGSPYTVFTAYKRAWLSRPLPRAEELLAKPIELVAAQP